MDLNGIAHKNLTDPQLHEPKGASTATAGQVPFADGEGGTAWHTITPDKLDIEEETEDVAETATASTPDSLDVLGLPGTASETMTAASNFTTANQNTLNVSTKVNEIIQYASSLQRSHNDLVTKYNTLLLALKNLGLIEINNPE